MNILLDTQIALWAWANPDRIPDSILSEINRAGNEVYFSQVSTWEIQIKYGVGKLDLPERPERFVPAAIRGSGFAYLPMEDRAFFFLDRLPEFHRDPFDRLLIAHAITGQLHLATTDSEILRYPVLTLD